MGGAHQYRGVHGFIVVYDVTDAKSFANLDNWLREIARFGPENPIVMLAGNKCDLKLRQVVSFETGQEYSDSKGIQFFETSAKDAINVEQLFIQTAAEIKKVAPETEQSTTSTPAQTKRKISKCIICKVTITVVGGTFLSRRFLLL